MIGSMACTVIGKAAQETQTVSKQTECGGYGMCVESLPSKYDPKVKSAVLQKYKATNSIPKNCLIA